MVQLAVKIFPAIQTNFTSDAHPELPRAEMFVRPQGYGPGCMSAEEAEFVWSVVRIAKPLRALETGCEGGLTTCSIARALEDNIRGYLDTVEWNSEWLERTRDMLKVHQLEPRVVLHLGGSMNYIRHLTPSDVFDFALLDSSIPTRLEEFDALMKGLHLRAGALVILHDTAPHHPMRGATPLFRDWIKDQPYADRVRSVELPSPRGIMLIEIR